MKLKGMTTHKEALARMMKRPGFKEAYDTLEPEYKVVDALISARIKKNLTQKELAQRLGVTQSALSRFETGRANPTYAWFNKVARALGLKITVEPA